MGEMLKTLEGEVVSFTPDIPHLLFDVVVKSPEGEVRIRYSGFKSSNELVEASRELVPMVRVRACYIESETPFFYFKGSGKIELLEEITL